MPGFGYFDACEYEPQADSTAWIIKDVIPKNSLGFFAGPPKANASPYGGKSVLQRKIALSIITGQPFFGNEVLEKGRVMFVNLDEDQEKQIRLYYRMTGGAKIPGYLISKARSCRFPEELRRLEEDIKEARPIVCLVDPLQRTIGIKDITKQVDVGPIINDLKRIVREYSCTMGVSHHSNKNKDRDKESTASWLNGSTDLDAAWDFCLCVEYNKQGDHMHLRNFQKEKAKTDLYYDAEIINGDEIIDLHQINQDLKGSRQARQLYYYLSKLIVTKTPVPPIRTIEKDLVIPKSTIDRNLTSCPILKKLYNEALGNIPYNIESLGHVDVPFTQST